MKPIKAWGIKRRDGTVVTFVGICHGKPKLYSSKITAQKAIVQDSSLHHGAKPFKVLITEADNAKT